MTSDKKIAANQQNALKSTGPKNTFHTRNNPHKHGLYAQRQFISEKQRPAFESLSAEFHDQLEPTTPMQRKAVDRIVYCAWQCELCHALDLLIVNKQLMISEQELLVENSAEVPVAAGWYGATPNHARQAIKLLDYATATLQNGSNFSEEMKKEITQVFGAAFLTSISQWTITDNATLQAARMLAGHSEMFKSELPRGDGKVIVPDPGQTRELMFKLIAQQRQHVEETRLILDQRANGLGGRGTPLLLPRHAERAQKNLQDAVRWLAEVRSRGL